MNKNYQVIIRSVLTEKSSNSQASTGQYTFVVAKNASKIDIKNAVKEIYGADVEKVQTIVTPRKTRLVKGKYEWIKRPNYKKAIITLKGKKTIDPNKLEFPKSKKDK